MRHGILSLMLLLTISLQGCFPIIAAGAGSGALMAADRRSSGIYIEDEAIENRALFRIRAAYKEDVHVNVTSFNRNVLVTGEVPDAATKEAIGKIVGATENVNHVYNELSIELPRSLTSRGNDTLITSRVKFNFGNNKQFSANHVKVVTENRTVYLMGIVTRAEADAATEIARTTSGVYKVVRVFEYLD